MSSSASLTMGAQGQSRQARESVDVQRIVTCSDFYCPCFLILSSSRPRDNSPASLRTEQVNIFGKLVHLHAQLDQLFFKLIVRGTKGGEGPDSLLGKHCVSTAHCSSKMTRAKSFDEQHCAPNSLPAKYLPAMRVSLGDTDSVCDATHVVAFLSVSFLAK